MSDVDDGSIADGWTLLRRIHPDQIVPDKRTGELRVSSAAFRDPEMSVDVEELLKKVSLDWHFSLKDHAGYSLMKFLAAVPRSHGLRVIHSPLSGNSAHAEVKGQKSTSIARALSNAAEWVHRV